MSLISRILTSRADYEKVRKEHERLFSTAENPNLFLSPTWVSTSLEEFEASRPPVIVTLWDGDRLEAFWPFFRTLAISGEGLWALNADSADNFAPLCRTQTQQIHQTLLQKIDELLESYLFAWIPLVPRSYTEEHLQPFLAQTKPLHLLRARSINHRAQFSVSFDEFLSSHLGTKSRRMLRYAENRLQKSGSLKTRFLSEPDAILARLEDVRKIERKSWQAQQGADRIFNPLYQNFFQKTFLRLAKCGHCQLALLEYDERAIAYEWSISHGSHYGMFTVAFDPEFSEHSPGKLLLLKSMEHAHASGFKLYDFLQGAHEYKERYATETEVLDDFILCQRSWKGRLNHTALRLAQFLNPPKINH